MGMHLLKFTVGIAILMKVMSLEGDLHSYGFNEIYKDGEEVGRIYVDDYMASESAAKDWCFKD